LIPIAHRAPDAMPPHSSGLSIVLGEGEAMSGLVWHHLSQEPSVAFGFAPWRSIPDLCFQAAQRGAGGIARPTISVITPGTAATISAGVTPS
jgi:hypothetical protein